MSFTRFIQNSLFFILLIRISGCQAATDSQQKTTSYSKPKTEQTVSGFSKKKENKKYSKQKTSQVIPAKVYTVLEYVRKYNRAPDGFSGGRKFGNYERRLPLKDSNSKPMKYLEWDVNPKIKGKNRGTERLITSETKQAWYTKDHYNTFVEVK
ncbi:ribonuclease domain-containing protein [Dyadobacter sp. NIV53]|uniref:ribonuclease domain-containing protein n=1 Tax=Dyadobacter sp. NIV53 TaxID=2861765 RepID=UPI001C8542A0|nr:ribonuclease domain-containing protein [Dyadobacter sp. NIV53]